VFQDIDAVGVDGCSSGWVCCFSEGAIRALVLPSFQAVLNTFPNAIVAVDVPIGLPDAGRRQCDGAARKLLKFPRSTSVFSAPIRPMLGCATHTEACKLGRRIEGRALSIQCFSIVPKIVDVDSIMTSEFQAAVFEVHPEVCFWAANGGCAMKHKKSCAQGIAERSVLLNTLFDVIPTTPRGAERDDVLDATVALWSAVRIRDGSRRTVTAAEQTDRRGLHMQIWF